MPIEDPVLQFTVLVTTALLVQVAAKRVHLPGLLGLLLLGMLLGPGGVGVLPVEPIVEMLGQVGLIYVMFIAGLEIDLETVREHRREALLFGLLAFVLSATPAVGAGLLMGFEVPAAVLLGALISSHTLIAYPALLALGLHRQVPVVTAVGGTLITDTLALVVLAIVLSVGAAGAGAIDAALPLTLLVLLSMIAYATVPRLSRWFLHREGASTAEKALFVFAVLLVLAAAAQLIGTEEILGAFIAGLTLNRTLARREELREHLEFVGRMLFIPFFFIWTGTLLELEILVGEARVWMLGGILFVLVVTGKASAAWITGRMHGYDWRERLLMTGLTVPQAAATLAITITAFQEGLFESEMVDAVVILILVTCVVGPVLTLQVGKRMKRRLDEAPDPVHPRAGEPTSS